MSMERYKQDGQLGEDRRYLIDTVIFVVAQPRFHLRSFRLRRLAQQVLIGFSDRGQAAVIVKEISGWIATISR